MADSKWSEEKNTSRAKLKATSQQERLHKWKEHLKNQLETHWCHWETYLKIIIGQLNIKLL